MIEPGIGFVRLISTFALLFNIVYANHSNDKFPLRCNSPHGYVEQPLERDFICMKKIIINSKKHGTHEVLVDDEDFDALNKYKWSVRCAKQESGNIYYAVRTENKVIQVVVGESTVKKREPNIIMHRVIMGVTDPKIYIDHKDHNGLNNQKFNLRTCTIAENVRNRRGRGASKFIGVSYESKLKYVSRKTGEVKYYSKSKTWRAVIMIGGKNKVLGTFLTEEDAARAYDKKAIEVFGEFANLNFKT